MEKKKKRKRGLKIVSIIAVIAVVCIAIGFIANEYIVPMVVYNKAIVLMEEGNIDDAYMVFQELGNYKDSAEKAACIRLNKNNEAFKNAKARDFIKFGAYEQDNNISNGKEDIEWLVLEVKNGKALVISKNILDYEQYNRSYAKVTWEICTLREWLNNDFINSAFSKDEQTMILTVTVSANRNSEYETTPGNTTQDQVFLLSIAEANKYFSNSSARCCKPTDYAVANSNLRIDGSFTSWWLRSPGNIQYYAASIRYNGDVYNYGTSVVQEHIGVRPAMWIDFGS